MARVLFDRDGFRLVETGTNTFTLEMQDGIDAMGEKRWVPANGNKNFLKTATLEQFWVCLGMEFCMYVPP